MTFEEFWHPFQDIYDKREARAVACWILEVCFGLTMTDIVGGAVEQISTQQLQRLLNIQQRLLKGEPVQYVAGVADFGPRQFYVASGVLIPRPETYMLCQWIEEENSSLLMPHSTLLDIGTGSGCIACTLAAQLPQVRVSAWDISPSALNIARKNAEKYQVDINFKQCDLFKVKYGCDMGKWDLIVSNPPYICDSEAEKMEDRVLDYEPKLALFVPDDNPLLFYSYIGKFAKSALKEGGRLYFEINPRFGEYLKDIFLGMGFNTVVIKKDQFGKNRFIRAIWH